MSLLYSWDLTDSSFVLVHIVSRDGCLVLSSFIFFPLVPVVACTMLCSSGCLQCKWLYKLLVLLIFLSCKDSTQDCHEVVHFHQLKIQSISIKNLWILLSSRFTIPGNSALAEGDSVMHICTGLIRHACLYFIRGRSRVLKGRGGSKSEHPFQSRMNWYKGTSGDAS